MEKWISVKDMLPEIAKQVSIVLEMDGNSRAAKSYPGFRANGGWYVLTVPDKSWVPNEDKHYRITHWMPLPEPPKD